MSSIITLNGNVVTVNGSALTSEEGESGLEYEMGTYTPTADIARPKIYFSNQHSAPPMFLMIADATDGITPFTANYAEVYGNWNTTFGNLITPDTSPVTNYYGAVSVLYNGTYSSTPLSRTDTEASSNSVTYWVNNEYFRPSTMGSTRYWLSGRTYKWIAVWSPTT